MAIGPVQLIVLGFEEPDFHGEIIAELEKLRSSDTVRVIDALAVHKDADGEIEIAHLSNLSRDEAIELGSTIGALLGLGIEGEEGIADGAVAGADAAANGLEVFSDDDAWDIAAIAAMFAMSNRLANAFSIRPNEEFYGMGRESRG